MHAFVDTVVRRALDDDQLRTLLNQMDRSEKGVSHMLAAGVEGVLSAFSIREHAGRRFIGTGGLYLAPGIIYESAHVEDVWMPPMPRMHSTAKIRIIGRAIPDSVITALAGRPASAIIDHPALDDPRLVVSRAGWAPYVIIKSRSNPIGNRPGPGERTIDVLLPQIMDDIAHLRTT